jgi:hypothetical protein
MYRSAARGLLPVKTRLAIAIAFGVGSTLIPLLLMDVVHSNLWGYLILPGHAAIILIFGAHAGPDGFEHIAMVVGLVANIVVYSLPAFLIFQLLGVPK